MKKKRQQDLKNLITNEVIRTQEELTEKLSKMGYDVTQATVSRDIKELKIIKTADETGNLRYCIPNGVIKQTTDLASFVHLIKSIRVSLNIIVIKTHIGMAPGVAAVIDDLQLAEVLGTIAGDDTIMIVCDGVEKTEKIYKYLYSNLS